MDRKKPKKYTSDFKLKIGKLAAEKGASKIAKEYSLAKTTVQEWCTKWKNSINVTPQVNFKEIKILPSASTKKGSQSCIMELINSNGTILKLYQDENLNINVENIIRIFK